MQKKYKVRGGGAAKISTLSQIIENEEKLVNFIIERLGEDFSMKAFKEEYAFWSTDFCHLLEKPFTDYLVTFLQDEGMSAFAMGISEANKIVSVFEMVEDWRYFAQADRYQKQLENASFYSPPYLQIYSFAKHISTKWPVIFSIFEWRKDSDKKDFEAYINKYFQGLDTQQILKQVDTIVQSQANINHIIAY